ncbi:NAD(P)-dependent alcohol dehydrogenase [Aliiroseovarius sp. S1339]|uniref:NAD(P)-dependent alcohol dehydrogenase n=1 Tax=Aliiroseovarius sp. S1339 TaxID=2936990 RepID=UPI0020C0200D|nr:NAD(P)-dependent alcohol dehydrogenase [Aliiroseovarius sp. S1339]MCK8462422.1 NAD(P)-dependent alcohol dehydrogenase [Aliiroseovarius sp. S1339]
MKAAVYKRYGPPEVVKIAEVTTPDPGDDELLIKTYAATVTSGDWRARTMIGPRGFGPIPRLAFGIIGPRRKILGTEMAGRIEAVGKDVTAFKVGEDVIAFPGLAMGCHAEYITMPASGKVVHKPRNLSFPEAAALSFAGTAALHFLRGKGDIKSGETVLIIGASGALGTMGVQIAKYFGADVTGVCSTVNLQLVTSIGAERVVDHTQADITSSSETFDVVFDTVGALPLTKIRRMLRSSGRGVLAAGSLLDNIKAPVWSLIGPQKFYAGVAVEAVEDMRLLVDMAETGSLKPVIDRVYPFDQITQAHAHVGTGHKKGNVVVQFEQD